MLTSISKVFPLFVLVFLGDVWNNNDLAIILFYTLFIVVESL